MDMRGRFMGISQCEMLLLCCTMFFIPSKRIVLLYQYIYTHYLHQQGEISITMSRLAKYNLMILIDYVHISPTEMLYMYFKTPDKGPHYFIYNVNSLNQLSSIV
jgi:hypothetical protein